MGPQFIHGPRLKRSINPPWINQVIPNPIVPTRASGILKRLALAALFCGKLVLSKQKNQVVAFRSVRRHMAAISAVQKKMRLLAAAAGDDAPDIGKGRLKAEETQEFLGKLPPQEIRELDIELGVLQLGCAILPLILSEMDFLSLLLSTFAFSRQLPSF